MERDLKKYISIVFVFALLLSTNVNAQRIELPDAAELEIAIQKLNVLGSVLYIAAHPDDENTSVLAYFSKGQKYRTAYLSITRGSGGQNLVGPEKGAEIGIIRTQELMSARQIDGAEQFFTRAIDFGYSKTADETFDFWEKEEHSKLIEEDEKELKDAIEDTLDCLEIIGYFLMERDAALREEVP